MQRWRGWACAASLLVYFLYFNLAGLRVHFALDDIGNMAHYYRGGPLALLVSQFTVWRGDYRPLGGLFYLPILSFAGLNPVPYQAALLLILLLNAYLLYRLARLLGADWLAAVLAALVVCYHAGVHNLYYNAAFIYDALCGTFYLGALLCHVGPRQAGRMPGARRTALFLALFLCALNAKEMALTLPAMLLVYEWLYHHRALPNRTILLAAGLTLLDVYGKWFGPDPLASADAYHPVFALRRVRDFQRVYLGDLLFGWGSGWGGILLLWAALAYLAWRRDRPILRFCWWMLMLAPLPIEFLIGKSLACLYVPLLAGAIFAAVVFTDLVRALARALQPEPLARRLGPRGTVAVLVAIALFFWARQNRAHQRMYAEPVMAVLGQQSWAVIQQFQVLQPRVRPGARVAFLDDPFHSWDMLFVAELWFRDRGLDIHVWRDGALNPDELARTDAIFTFENSKLIRLK